MQRPQFTSEEVYHIYNRGVEKRTTFLDKKDYLRFLHDLYEFNDIKPAPASNIRLNTRRPQTAGAEKIQSCLEVELPNIRGERKMLVDILAFCLMPNHFHLLVQQKEENGIARFMQKLGTGYTNYFNKKYERVGGLFQGRFKAVLIERDGHFLHISNYIHANPLEILMPSRENRGARNATQAIVHLENYRWSSFADYIGKRNFPSIIKKEFFLEVFGGSENYKKQFTEWITQGKELMEEPATLE